MRRYLKTLMGAVVLAALWLGFNYYNKRKGEETSKNAEKPKEMILPVKADQVQSVTITPKDGQAFTLARDTNSKNWTITQPRKLAADQQEVSSYVESLVGTTVESVVDEHPSSVKDFDLDPPVTTLTVSTSGKPAELTLRIGDQTPTGDGLYAQTAGNPRLITLPGYDKSVLEKTLFDLRDRHAATIDPDQVQGIAVTYGAKSYTLTKNPEGYWDLALPPAVRADTFAVENLTSQLRGLSMASILAEDKTNTGPYGFAKPTLRVKLTSAAGAQSVVVGKKDGNQYDAMNSALDPVFTITSDFVTAFEKDPADLRDKGFFSFSSFDAKKVDLTTPKEHRVFEQQNFKWKQTAPSAKDETTENMDALLSALTGLRATSFPKATSGNLTPFGLAKPLYTLKATFGEKNQTQTVEIGSAGNKYYARRDTDALPGEVTKETVEVIDKALSAL